MGQYPKCGHSAMRILLTLLAVGLVCVQGEIKIPEEGCRWISESFGGENKCDGNEVAVGSCGSGRHTDCNNQNAVTMLKCCDLPGFFYTDCTKHGANWGVPMDCTQLKGTAPLVEGICGSGFRHDCHGQGHEIECCSGSVNGTAVGPTSQCYWEYTAAFGMQVECGRDDEVIVGRCGSGEHKDCPGAHVHGIYCCELDFKS